MDDATVGRSLERDHRARRLRRFHGIVPVVIGLGRRREVVGDAAFP